MSELTNLPKFVAHENLADAIYRSLRQAITDASLPPGYRLREIPLSRYYGVSTTPIREALRRLEREGLVEISPHRGAIVPAVDLQEITDLYEAREVLECRAVRRAAEGGHRDFGRVEALLAQAAKVLDEPDQVRFNRIDVEFHRTLNDIGGNTQLAELAERAHRQIQAIRVRCSVYLQGRPAVSHAQHLALLAAVRTGDADRAEELARSHIHSVRDAVLQVLRIASNRSV